MMCRMWVECYMYRRIHQAVILTGVKELQNFDYFGHQKREGFHGSVSSMKQLAAWLLEQLESLENECNETKMKELWHILVQICLWGNK